MSVVCHYDPPLLGEGANMTIVCRYCGEQIVLNLDSEVTRKAQTDPHEQMRSHIFEKHLSRDFYDHGYRTKWIVDMLFFECPSEPEAFEESLFALVRWFQREPVSNAPVR